MSGFSSSQLRKLTSKLDRTHVQTRVTEGKQLDYIEGWFALSEANAIFGFSNWDRETVHFERMFERVRGDITSCGYFARVRVRVRAGDQDVVREGTGCGTASTRNGAEAHELAIKAAETDATKRALATFGNRFGLCLYDREQAGVTERVTPKLTILGPNGQHFADGLSAEGFCTALRKHIETTRSAGELRAWRERNAPQIARLRQVAPELKTQSGRHYAEVLESLFLARMALVEPLLSAGLGGAQRPNGPSEASKDPQEATDPLSATATSEPSRGSDAAPRAQYRASASKVDNPPSSTPGIDLPSPPANLTPDLRQSDLAPSRIASGPRIDKACLAIGIERRRRDKAHLRHVANLPCLVCGRRPAHAHHIRYAQTHGMSQKVSDEFVVPLCFLHHDELHRAGSELGWWRTKNVSPLPVAAELWSRSKQNELLSPDPSSTAAMDSNSLPTTEPLSDEQSVKELPL